MYTLCFHVWGLVLFLLIEYLSFESRTANFSLGLGMNLVDIGINRPDHLITDTRPTHYIVGLWRHNRQEHITSHVPKQHMQWCYLEQDCDLIFNADRPCGLQVMPNSSLELKMKGKFLIRTNPMQVSHSKSWDISFCIRIILLMTGVYQAKKWKFYVDLIYHITYNIFKWVIFHDLSNREIIFATKLGQVEKVQMQRNTFWENCWDFFHYKLTWDKDMLML